MTDEKTNHVGLGWQPIDTAPKDGRTVLVKDTVLTDGAPFIAAYWLEGGEWQGWAYGDGLMCDCNPIGPQPEIWFDVPLPPTSRIT